MLTSLPLVMIFVSALAVCTVEPVVLWSHSNPDHPLFMSGTAMDASSDQSTSLIAAFKKSSVDTDGACQPALIDGLIGNGAPPLPTSLPQLITASETVFVAVIERKTPVWSIDEHRVRTLLSLRITDILSDQKRTLHHGQVTFALIDGGVLTAGGARLCTSGRQLDSATLHERLFVAGMIRPMFRRTRDDGDLPMIAGTLLHIHGDNVELVLPLTNEGTLKFPLAKLPRRSNK